MTARARRPTGRALPAPATSRGTRSGTRTIHRRTPMDNPTGTPMGATPTGTPTDTGRWAPPPRPQGTASPPRTAPTPALFLAGPTGKHSTHPGPSGAAGPSPAGPAPAPSPSSAASSAAAGLARLLSPARERPERGVTVDSRTAAHGAQSAAELVNSVSSDACDPTVRDIPGAARSRSSGGSGHLAAVPMVPCLTESTSRTEPRGPPEGPGRPLPRPDRHRPA